VVQVIFAWSDSRKEIKIATDSFPLTKLMSTAVRILIAEDEAVARRTLEFIFQKTGYELWVISDGGSALTALSNSDVPTVAVLDILMPVLSGIEVCKKIRDALPTLGPYIILLTVKGKKEDILSGLEAGADDYLTKPFDPDELLARVQVGIRMLELQHKLANRVKELEATISRVKQLQGLLRGDTNAYEFGPFRLDAAERRLLRDGKPIPLTSKIFDLLLLLVQNSGHLLEKEEIMNEVWPDIIVEENNLTVSMSTLRKALGEEHGQHNYIKTIPKRGYMFTAHVRKLKAREQ
jgi:sigma-B regulation protein RsbU (phosphoserine phosphatase)